LLVVLLGLVDILEHWDTFYSPQLVVFLEHVDIEDHRDTVHSMKKVEEMD
jgi:hypothetical protein